MARLLQLLAVCIQNSQPDELYITVEFHRMNADQTEMIISHEGIPKEMHDDCVTGWSESIDKLQRLVERN